MDINLFDETVLKSITALVTLAGMLASILAAGYKLFFRVKTTTESLWEEAQLEQFHLVEEFNKGKNYLINI
ncbi:hypothetical protein OCF10_19805 [Bacillus cereus]|nr:hypothetical protein [Bacillus cereus]